MGRLALGLAWEVEIGWLGCFGLGRVSWVDWAVFGYVGIGNIGLRLVRMGWVGLCWLGCIRWFGWVGLGHAGWVVLDWIGLGDLWRTLPTLS